MKIKKILAAATVAILLSAPTSQIKAFADETIKGDCNRDGAVDAKDATEILKFYADTILNGRAVGYIPSWDYNDDGEIDAKDATEVLVSYANYMYASGQWSKADFDPLPELGGWTYDQIRQKAAGSPLNSVQLQNTGNRYQFYNSQRPGVIKNMTVSNREISIIQNFGNSHWGANWTAPEKVLYTLLWIHYNVKYDYKFQWVGKYGGYADCILNGRVGQCMRYNGTLAETMAYLGYDVNFVQGYHRAPGPTRDGKTNQHFWTEIKINGTYYVMETGNSRKSGDDWWHFCDSYVNCPSISGQSDDIYYKNFDHAD